jgi:hypothetical protein
LIPKHDAVAVGNTRDRVPVRVTEGITHGLIANLFRSSLPDIAEFIAELKVISVAKAVQPGRVCFFFEAEEPARDFAVDFAAFVNTFEDHTSLFGLTRVVGMRCFPYSLSRTAPISARFCL